MDPATIALLKDLGYPAALSVVLLFAVKFMFSIYSAAQSARIDALERAFLAAKKTNEEQAIALLSRSDKHAAELRAIIASSNATLSEHSRLSRLNQEVLRKLVDSIGDNWTHEREQLKSAITPSVPPVPSVSETGIHNQS